MEKSRDIGLDVCRILSMLGIVLLHILDIGGVLGSNTGNTSIAYWAAEWVYICAVCSVDVFAMMSGYFGIFKKKKTCFRCLELIAIVLCYSVIITVVFLIFAPAKLNGIKDIIKGVVPALVGRYWYITCFIPVLFFQPFLNKMLLALSVKQHACFVALSFLLLSCLPSVIPVDFFRLEQGYSFVWLLVLYIIGALFRRTKDQPYFTRVKKYAIPFFLLCSFVLLFGNLLIQHVIGKNYNYMVSYTSPIVLLMGVSVFVALAGKNEKKENALLRTTASVTFDVYLIHGHVLVYDLVLAGAFAWIRNLAWYFIPIISVGCAIAIFVVCAGIGWIRAQLFRLLRVQKLLMKLAARIDRLLYAGI